jgi:phosphate:Na+ symporter
MLILFPYFLDFISSVTPGDADFVITTQQQALQYGAAIGDKPFIARHIANTHTLFNILNVLIFLPMVGLLAKLSTRFIKGVDSEVDYRLQYIDSRVLNTPPLALSQARLETNRMAILCLECLDETIVFTKTKDTRLLEGLRKREDLIDLLQREILDFLVAISQRPISQDVSKEISSLMHMVNDLEKVGDYCENLWELGERKIDQKIIFSQMADDEFYLLVGKTREFLSYIQQAIEHNKVDIAKQAQAMENEIDSLEASLRSNHILRLNTGECSVNTGLIFIDMLHNCEKIGDHTHSVARAILGKK